MKVILAIDGSAHSDLAVERVGSFEWPTPSEICVVIVDAPLGESMVGDSAVGASAYDEIVTRQRAESNEHLERAAERLARIAPNLPVATVLLEGSAKEEINRYATQWEADLIVLGSRGRGAVSSVLLGSVSMTVSMNAPCSVLIVRGGGMEKLPAR